MRAVLDTNVLLSDIAYPASIPGKIVAAWRHGSLDVVLSEYILDELRLVLPRLRHRHGLSATEIDDLADILSIQAEMVTPSATPTPELRDDKEPVLGTLLSAMHENGAACLITGDKDLLALAHKWPIISPAEFWKAHGY